MQENILSENMTHDGDCTRETLRTTIKTRFAPKNLVWRSVSFFLIHCFLTPIARIRCVVGMRHTVRGHKRLRGYKRSGYFLYGNRTDVPGADSIPLALCDPKHTYRIVPSRIKRGRTVISPWRLLCGDIPTPADASDTRAFLEAVEKRAVERGAVVVYPETLEGIDPTLDAYSFPARFDEPAFCFTTVTEPGEDGAPCTVTYLDGPFYPCEGRSLSEQTDDLRARITARMASRLSHAQEATDAR